MLASYIIKTITEEKTRKESQGQGHEDNEDRNRTPTKNNVTSTKSPMSTEKRSSSSSEQLNNGQHKGNDSIDQTSQVPEYEEEEEEGVNSLEKVGNMSEFSDVPRRTLISLKKPITLIKCTDSECGCNATHCPFCEPSYHKPNHPAKIRDHLELKHFASAIQYEDFLIMKCYPHQNQCANRKEPHYHCPLCKDKILMKRTGMLRHLMSHVRKQGKKSTVIKIPDIKRPDTISVNGYEVELCEEDCLKKVEKEEKDVDKEKTPTAHYHCPRCEALHVDRKSIICHIWRCEDNAQKEEEPNDSQISDAKIDKAYLPNNDVPPIEKVKDMKAHVSIVRSLQDLPHKKCQKPDCCGGKKFHCSLCTEERFKPCYLKKMKTHNYTHWNRRIKYKGYNVLPCYLECQLKERDTTKIVPHFHCPICGGSRRRRDCFLRHLDICRGKGKPVARLGYSSREHTFFKGLSLEAVDKTIDDDINDAIFDDDNIDTDNNGTTGVGEETNGVDLNDLKVFSRVTAEISSHLVSELKSRGLDDTYFDEVSSQTGTKHLLAPGITSPVHSLEGDLKKLTEAMQMIKQVLGITDNNPEKCSCNCKCHNKNPDTITATDMVNNGQDTSIENDGDTETIDQDIVPDIHVEPAKTPNGKNQDRKRGATQQQENLIPAKKIKPEPVDSFMQENNLASNSSMANTVIPSPEKRYSTRGVKVDFAKLSAGEITKKDVVNISNQINSGDLQEFVLVNEKGERSTMKVPKEVAKYFREKILLEKLSQTKLALVVNSGKGAYAKQTEKAIEVKTGIQVENVYNKKQTELGKGLIANVSDAKQIQKSVQPVQPKAYNVSNEEGLETDNWDDSLVDKSQEILGPDGTPLAKDSFEYFVKKFKVGTCATIPRIIMNHNFGKGKDSDSPVKKSYQNVNKYQCGRCDFACKTFEECTDHMNAEHPDDSVYRCDVCERHFDKPQNLNLHLTTKHGPQLEAKQYECETCSKVYMHEYALELHIETKHKNPPRQKYSCRHCDFIGEDRSDLESHVRECHFKEGFVCSFCGKTFQSKGLYKQHMDNLHLRTNEVKCSVCTRVFANPRYLKMHMEVHVGEKKHACSVCDLRFRKKSNMLAHEQTHMKKDDRTYRYVCAQCGQKFNSKAGFFEHNNKHTGERPFLCDICGKSFAFKSSVKNHKLHCHSDARPFQCSVCEKSFKTNMLMTQHMTSHTGTSNHKCDGCNKNFSTATTLKTHKPKCKGLRYSQMVGNNVVVITNPKFSNLNGESILQNVQFKVQAQSSPQKQTTVAMDTLLNPLEIDHSETTNSSVQGQIEVPTQETPTDVAVYLCSECNAAFNDFALAEQHVLMGHEPTSANQVSRDVVQTDSVMDAVNVILNEVSDSL